MLYEYKAELVKVIDGDTIEVDFDLGFGVWLKNQRIRLAGIDTPEIRTSDKEMKAMGKAALAGLIDVLDDYSGPVIIRTELDPDDKFGRILGHVQTGGGIDVNKWMIERNYAVAYDGKSKVNLEQLHKANATKLRERGEIP
jgi:micrococcal nuclease